MPVLASPIQPPVLAARTQSPEPRAQSPEPRIQNQEPSPNRIRFVIAKKDRLALEQISDAAEAVAAAHGGAEIDRCQTAAAALVALRARPTYLAVFGLSLPDMDGLDLLARVVAGRLALRLLVVSSRHDERVRHLLRPGRIDGFFDPACEGFVGLVEAIRTVVGGGTWFKHGPVANEPPPRTVAPRLDQMLSEHEQSIFALIGDGCGDQAAATILRLSDHTVHTHRATIMRKLGVRTRPELMREAIRRGVVRHTPERILRPGSDHELWPEAMPGSPSAK